MHKGVPTRVFVLDRKRRRKVVFVKVLITEMRRKPRETAHELSIDESRLTHPQAWAKIDAQLITSTPH